MAEPKPVDAMSESSTPEESPKLVAVSENTTTPESASASGAEPAEPDRKGVPTMLFAIVAGLLLLAGLGLYAQTQRATAQAEQIALLGNQIEGLEVQLAAANTQIATYDTQLALVEDSVREMYEKMGGLLDLVSMGPVLGEPEAPAGETSPNEGGSLELR